MRALLLLSILLCATGAAAGERILALSPHACETLYAIGAEHQLVGAVAYCDYPAAARALPRVGSYNRINVEAAIALKPTLAIVMNAQVPGAERLRELGVRVVASYPESVGAVLEEIRFMGRLTGREAAAQRLAGSLQARLHRLLQQRPATPVPVFYEVWAEPLLTAGKQTFIDDLLRQVGMRNVFGEVELEAPRVNIEAVVRAAPQVVLIPSEKRDVKARTAFWRKWLGEDVRVLSIDPDLVHRPGPRLLDGMELLAKMLAEDQP